MKRVARAFEMPALLQLLLLILPLAPAAFAQAEVAAEVLPWANELRTALGLQELQVDPLLERAAAAYAADLRRRGILSHVDEQGRRALQRLRDLGGTTVLVGEILGSGAVLKRVSAAWESSSDHREVVLNPLWTHCGAASVSSGTTTVWVVLFTSHRIYPLEILRKPNGYAIHGRLVSARAEEPVLISGVEPIDPLHWDPGRLEFSFFVPLDRGEIYHRLGYRSRDGGLVVTNTFYPLAVVVKTEPFTSGRERESR